MTTPVRLTRNVLLIFSFLICFGGLGWAADFSADIISTSTDARDMPGKGKIYMKGNMMRMGYEQAVTILRPDKGLIWILMEQNKMYMEQPYKTGGRMQGWTDAMKNCATRVGKEKVSGVSCVKYEIKQNGDVVHYWISDRISFPVKIQDRNGYMLLENIKIGSISDGLFRIPRGYNKFSMPAMGGGMSGMSPNGSGCPYGR